MDYGRCVPFKAMNWGTRYVFQKVMQVPSDIFQGHLALHVALDVKAWQLAWSAYQVMSGRKPSFKNGVTWPSHCPSYRTAPSS